VKIAAALLAGVLFGLGLALSGMLDPVRVQGFLDVTGAWDPSLAFVLGGAVGVSALGNLLARHMHHPLFAAAFDIPSSRRIDAKLLGGSALFGIGWGLGGFCSGPALSALSLALPKAFVFVAAMLLGMWGYKIMTSEPSQLSKR